MTSDVNSVPFETIRLEVIYQFVSLDISLLTGTSAVAADEGIRFDQLDGVVTPNASHRIDLQEYGFFIISFQLCFK